MFSEKTVSDNLNLQATDIFKPIHNLTIKLHLEKSYAVFVHYQMTMQFPNQDFYSKLLINYANAGSMVHTGNQHYKTATGFYMANLNPGDYTFEVHYKSPATINMVSSDWQTAILQVLWAEDAYVVSDNIKCYPTPTATNAYNNWGPLRDIETVLHLPNNRAVIAAYQFSAELRKASHLVTALSVDGFHLPASTLLKGNTTSLDIHGASAAEFYKGPHYFNIIYRTPADLSFTDYVENYQNNKNLYAMMLPPSYKVVTVNPKNTFTLNNSNKWALTDVTHFLTLSKDSLVIIMYQYAGYSGNSHIVMRISIDSVPQKHTVSITGNTAYTGNFGLWQGSLKAGDHKVSLDYRSPAQTTNTVSSEREFTRRNVWMNRALTIIYCGVQ